MNDTVHPKIQDPRQVTRTLCHNAFGASIKILDPIRQLHDACGSGHAWLATANGHLIKHNGQSPQVIDRQLGFGFCLGDLISVGQSHHFNLGSRITTGTKKRASIRKSNQHVQLPVEFNAVVNCEFALMFNVVDRCTDIVSTRYTIGGGSYDTNLTTALAELGANQGLQVHPEQKTILNAFGAGTYQVNSTDHDTWCDLRGDLFNDIYNLSLLYLARNETPTLNYFNVDIGPIGDFDETEGVKLTKGDGAGGVHNVNATALHDAIDAKQCFRYILDGQASAPNTDERYGASRAGIVGSNLIFKTGSNEWRHPAQEAQQIADYYDSAAVGRDEGIPVSTTKDILNLWWDYIKADSETLVVTYAGEFYSEIYKTITASNALTSLPPNPDNLVNCNLYVPVWNTAALRHASVIDDDVLRGNTNLPIDPDLQSGAMIGVEQIVTTESDVTHNILFQSQPNPLLFKTEGVESNSITERILPHATLNQGSIASSSQSSMADTQKPETGDAVLNTAGAISDEVVAT